MARTIAKPQVNQQQAIRPVRQVSPQFVPPVGGHYGPDTGPSVYNDAFYQDTPIYQDTPTIDPSFYAEGLLPNPNLDVPTVEAEPMPRRRMGTPAPRPENYGPSPDRVWMPENQPPTVDPRFRRETGEGDIALPDPRTNPPASPVTPSLTTPQQPKFLPPVSPVQPNLTVPQNPNLLPPVSPVQPNLVTPEQPLPVPGPNVGVDTTAELVDIQQPQPVYIEAPMPLPIDQGPIGTQIIRPQTDPVGTITPELPPTLSPISPPVVAQETFSPPTLTETATAEPIQIQQPTPATEPPIVPDEVTTILDDIVPEVTTAEPKSIVLPESDIPQWAENPQVQQVQDIIDQAPSIQTAPVITQNPLAQPPIQTAPEITTQLQPEINPYEVALPPIDPRQQPAPVVTEQPITVAEDPLPVPEPVQLDSVPIPVEPKTMEAGEINFPPPGSNPTIFKDQEGDMVKNVPGHASGPHGYIRGPVTEPGKPPLDPAIVQANPEILAKTIDPSTTLTQDTVVIPEGIDVNAGPDITQIQEQPFTGEIADAEVVTETPDSPSVTTETTETFAQNPNLAVPDLPEQQVTPNRNQQVQAQEPAPGRGWLYTGPQGYAETRWSTSGASQGQPIISQTPYTSGPQVNRETGEITQQPLSWWSNRAGYDFKQNAPLPTGTPGSVMGGSTGTTGTTETAPAPEGVPGGSQDGFAGFSAQEAVEVSKGSITPVLDRLHPNGVSDGKTVIFRSDVDFDNWVDGNQSLRPDVGFSNLNYEKKDETGKIVGYGNKALDGFNELGSMINNVFDLAGDPSKTISEESLQASGLKGTKDQLKEFAKNLNKLRKELGQTWETSKDEAWGRKWNNLTETQEYGDLQPMGIFALLTNPPAAIGMTANALLSDIKNAAQGMFEANADYSGNPIQDVLNGAFHLLGQGAKAVGSVFSEIGQQVKGKLNFTSKDLKEDPMEVSRKLLYRSKNEDDEVGDLRYRITKTLLENGVKVKFHNNALSFDKAITAQRMADAKKVIADLGLKASMLDIIAGTDGVDWTGNEDFRDFLKELAKQRREAAQS